VPTIFGSSVDGTKIHAQGAAECTRVIPHDYIIMSRLPGVPLDSVWDNMSLAERKQVVDQVAEVFARLRSIQLSAIGNFVRGPNGRPIVGPMMEGSSDGEDEGEGRRRGPFPSWSAFVVTNIKQEIKYMLQSENKFVETTAYLLRIETLINTIESGDLERRFGSGSTKMDTLPEGVEQSISFLHGDFESRNMLVVGTKIVGLLDFEFAGGFPSEQEWCAGFEWLMARAEDPFDEGEQEKLRNMSDDQRELLEYFLRILKDKYGLQPYGKDHQEYKVVLYHLQVNIAPWWLRDTSREDWTEKQTQSMKTAADSLDRALKYLRC
ncbi:hypothetical protein BGZ65_010380, partial [Modicella reniformis]